jgi:hypothetical protein
MDPLTIALAAAKIAGGIFSNRAAKRQSRNQMLQAAITSNLVRANSLQSAASSYGSALVAANRLGGFSPNSFSTSWNNLAADLRQINYNQAAQNYQALATVSAGRMSLLNGVIGALSTLALSPSSPKKSRSGINAQQTSSATSQQKFLDRKWIEQMSEQFGGEYN